MKALVYHGPGQKAWQDVPDPAIIDPTDVIVAVDTTTICGTDLHILKGDVPTVTDGRILGHEGVGTIAEVGRAVPLTDTDAADLISAPRAAPLLNGYRGTRVIAREPLVDLALRLSTLADDLPEVCDLQLRPVLAGPVGVAVTSWTGRIGPPAAQPDARRRLG